MTLWRLEWLRLVRTRRIVALGAVFSFFGLLGPLTARYLSEIVSFAGGELEGATIEFPDPVPADGMVQYASNAMQVGALVVVVVAAGALAFDAIPEMGMFLRTRVPDIRRILLPRFAITAVAVVTAFVTGGLLAWYETWALIGGIDPIPVLAGLAYGALFLVFVVALVAAAAGRSRTVLSTVMISIVALLALPIAGIAGGVGRWLPSHLAGALGQLSAGQPVGDHLGAAVVTVIATAGLWRLAIGLARSREP